MTASTCSAQIRKACDALTVDRSRYQYKGKSREQADLNLRIMQMTETGVRYGYRRVRVLLRREGWDVNLPRVSVQLNGLLNKVPRRRCFASENIATDFAQ